MKSAKWPRPTMAETHQSSRSQTPPDPWNASNAHDTSQKVAETFALMTHEAVDTTVRRETGD